MSNSIADIAVKTIDGKNSLLNNSQTKFCNRQCDILCGYTPQYRGAQQLNQKDSTAKPKFFAFFGNVF